MSDFDDCFVFGFSVAPLHVQTALTNPQEEDEIFKAQTFGDSTPKDELLKHLKAAHLRSAVKNKQLMERLLSMAKEAEERRII